MTGNEEAAEVELSFLMIVCTNGCMGLASLTENDDTDDEDEDEDEDDDEVSVTGTGIAILTSTEVDDADEVILAALCGTTGGISG